MKIGIDIGGSHIGIGVVDENGRIIDKVETFIKYFLCRNPFSFSSFAVSNVTSSSVIVI